MTPDSSSSPWPADLRKAIRDAAGPGAAAEFQRIAEYVYQLYAEARGEAWGQFAVRQAAKTMLARTAAMTDPEVAAARAAHHQAGPPEAEHTEAVKAAYERHCDEAGQAWSELDAAFMAARRAELQAAWPQGFAVAAMSAGAGSRQSAAHADFGLAWTATAGFPGTALPEPAAQAGHIGRGNAQTASTRRGAGDFPSPVQKARAGPYTVTGWFTTTVGPSLHYTLRGTGEREVDYWRMPDGTAGAQVRSGDRWFDLDPDGPRYQAVTEGVREYEARNPGLAGYNTPQAARRAAGPGLRAPVAGIASPPSQAGRTAWSARTKAQLVAALARTGWSRDSVREACHRAACAGFAMTTNNAGTTVAIVTFGNTEVDLWDAEVTPGGDGGLRPLRPPAATSAPRQRPSAGAGAMTLAASACHGAALSDGAFPQQARQSGAPRGRPAKPGHGTPRTPRTP